MFKLPADLINSEDSKPLFKLLQINTALLKCRSNYRCLLVLELTTVLGSVTEGIQRAALLWDLIKAFLKQVIRITKGLVQLLPVARRRCPSWVHLCSHYLSLVCHKVVLLSFSLCNMLLECCDGPL